MPDWILCHELQERRVREVVLALKRHPLVDQRGMTRQMPNQPSDVSFIDEFDGATEREVLDAFVMRECLFRRIPSLNMDAEPRPASVPPTGTLPYLLLTDLPVSSRWSCACFENCE